LLLDVNKEVLETCLNLGYNDSTTCRELINECDGWLEGDTHIYD
jgi:hypothetical protein